MVEHNKNRDINRHVKPSLKQKNNLKRGILNKKYHRSRFGFSSTYILSLILLIASIASFYFSMEMIFTISFFGIFLLLLIVAEIYVKSQKILLSNDEVVIQKGLLSKQIRTIDFDSITDIHVEQSVFQRIFRYGNIVIGIPGSNIHHTASKHPSHDNSGLVVNKIQKVKEIEKIIRSRI